MDEQLELDLFKDHLSFFRWDDNVELRLDPVHRTMWGDQENICNLFDVEHQSQVSKLITRFEKKELPNTGLTKKDTFANLTKVDKAGRKYPTPYYSLDVIIYVGFRLEKSPKATAFRRKATNLIIDKIFEKSNNILELQNQVKELINKNNDLEDLLDQYKMGANTYNETPPSAEDI